MNEQIRQLLKQATTNVNPEDREWVFSRVDQAKFAKLIVLKCAEIGEQSADGNYEVRNKILEYFGVVDRETA